MFHALLQISFYLLRTPDYFSVCIKILIISNILFLRHSGCPGYDAARCSGKVHSANIGGSGEAS